ncbi:LytR C-terminal domain-containing protein [Georgenia sp. 10Sc9-8]|uniref:LytR C-terminal domain-containing protein n=1 Tax=Georgenia halotolerans TaxID=3028317 RepID=A0ABT5U322_9MICO|nr:LytR C-terminal domain-containing protein [Georgenia halotolerans]
MSTTPEERAYERAERRRRVQQRQTVIFGGLIAVLLVAALVSAAVWTGMLPTPLDRGFSAPEEETEEIVQVCPPPGSTPVPLSEITANVLNGTDRSGLAGATASDLVSLGVVVNREANFSDGYPGAVQLIAGPIGVVPAYTLARLFPGSEVILDEGRTSQAVDVVLGSEFSGMLSAEEAEALDPEAELEAPEDCTEVDLPEPDEGGETDEAVDA